MVINLKVILEALDEAHQLTDLALATPMVTINAWNEWTEGSALLPDTVNGTDFLERIRRVFGPSDPRES